MSIVNYGGRLNVAGTRGAPVRDHQLRPRHRERRTCSPTTAAPTSARSAARCRSRARELSASGFWSGRTGGLSLTGTDRPNSGSLDELGETLQVGKRAERERAAIAETQPEAEPRRATAGNSTLSQVLPAGALPVPCRRGRTPSTASCPPRSATPRSATTPSGCSSSGANGLDVRRSSFDDNLVDGLVMHRYVVNAVVEDHASRNAGDGIVLARATTGIVLSEVDREQQRPQRRHHVRAAAGQRAQRDRHQPGQLRQQRDREQPVRSNGRYGVEVIGGTQHQRPGQRHRANEMGVVVREGPRRSRSSATECATPPPGHRAARRRPRRVVSGNIVTGGATSIYLRDAGADVKRQHPHRRRVARGQLVGDVGSATRCDENTISGRGPSAIDAERAPDVDRDGWDNDTSGWQTPRRSWSRSSGSCNR